MQFENAREILVLHVLVKSMRAFGVVRQEEMVAVRVGVSIAATYAMIHAIPEVVVLPSAMCCDLHIRNETCHVIRSCA